MPKRPSQSKEKKKLSKKVKYSPLVIMGVCILFLATIFVSAMQFEAINWRDGVGVTNDGELKPVANIFGLNVLQLAVINPNTNIPNFFVLTPQQYSGVKMGQDFQVKYMSEEKQGVKLRVSSSGECIVKVNGVEQKQTCQTNQILYETYSSTKDSDGFWSATVKETACAVNSRYGNVLIGSEDTGMKVTGILLNTNTVPKASIVATSTYNGGNPLPVSWTSISNIEYYRLDVYDGKGRLYYRDVELTTSSTEIPSEAFPLDNTYYITLVPILKTKTTLGDGREVNTLGETSYKKVTVILTEEKPKLPLPTVLAPVDGQLVDVEGTSTTLEVRIGNINVGVPIKYKITLKNLAYGDQSIIGFKEMEQSTSGTTTTSFTISNVDRNGLYKLYVEAIDTSGVYVSQGWTVVELSVKGSDRIGCPNGTCDPNETTQSCPSDCHCGNGIKEPYLGETVANCPEDMLDPICNQDYHCDADKGETYLNCITDCKTPKPPTDLDDIVLKVAPQKTEYKSGETVGIVITATDKDQKAIDGLMYSVVIKDQTYPGVFASGAKSIVFTKKVEATGDIDIQVTAKATGYNQTSAKTTVKISATDVCDNDGKCDEIRGETKANCPNDCKEEDPDDPDDPPDGPIDNNLILGAIVIIGLAFVVSIMTRGK